MPLYEYQCDTCTHRFEVIRKFSDAPEATCPKCGGPVQKLVSSPAIQFKGSGFYLTDYGRGTGKPDAAGDKGAKSEGGASGSEGKSEGKSDGKSDGKSESKSDAKSHTTDSKKSDSAGSGGETKSSSGETSSAKPAPAKSE